MCNRIIGQFFFNKSTITADVYLDLLTEYEAPQLTDLKPTTIFQQDGAPPYWGLHVCQFLNETFPGKWIGRDGPIPWPPHSPDITPLDFFYGGMQKISCIKHGSRIRDIADLKQRIRNAIATIDDTMLQQTWQEIKYCLDVLCATKGAHIEGY
ncbi:uncharacterized protein LOC126183304 [Schistocerca cancellata]|uniref:uncharacterized protein LOC126183303 n=1 Tax=Schistocerca cancellata TaxID=274614 RepID=UPI0021181F0C|nr:uncharacterized protein LOC126183303 [Schistocerca cancellata]XP_049781101.1 uncharacterized protein LOC126183303 [Schistocerca cancellata]XP_049781102.1 uncharacterized protein LOC126183303 [Schistocerca cancellata]XP_049781103.1 uncharacterized protein LOC126183304 [Schistocerca cancellata]XP_049781104.1 uncharacterized protein LOC126183304 [Schistocerca cancellata]XP_049781105.1 uncharacterized protein LOC126183304 [Schistocerca cancellata]